MKLLYDRFELVERDSRDVSVIWKALQIITFAIGSVFGLACAVILYNIIISFDSNCILFAKSIRLLDNDTKIDFISSQFVDFDMCYFPVFNPILSVIFSIIWISLFTMCPHGGSTTSGLKKPWRIVCPSLLFCFGYCIMCLVISSKYQSGMSKFLIKLQTAVHEKYANQAETLFRDTHIQSSVSVLCAWLYSTTWIVAFLILALRCIIGADFQYVHLKVELVEASNSDCGEKNTATSSILPSPEYCSATSDPLESPKTDDDSEKVKNVIVFPALVHSEPQS